MKKVLLSLAAVSAIAVAVPAAAQPYHGRATSVEINQREAEIARRIDTAYRRGALHPVEAGRLMAELRQIEAIEQRYRRNGMNQWERSDINVRLDRVQAQVRIARNDDNRRYGYGYGGQYGNRW